MSERIYTRWDAVFTAEGPMPQGVRDQFLPGWRSVLLPGPCRLPIVLVSPRWGPVHVFDGREDQKQTLSIFYAATGSITQAEVDALLDADEYIVDFSGQIVIDRPEALKREFPRARGRPSEQLSLLVSGRWVPEVVRAHLYLLEWGEGVVGPFHYGCDPH
jgi:hypothetical protein